MNLTVIENKVIENLPAIYKEFAEAKFKPQIRTYKDINLESKLSTLIMRTLLESGVKDSGDTTVCRFLTETMLRDLKAPKFQNLTFEEIELALHKGVRQEYGQYMGVNIQTLHVWLKSFLVSNERFMAIQEFSLKTKEIEQSNIKNSKPNPEGINRVLEILKPFAESVKPVYKQKTKSEIVKSEKDIFIQNCFKEHYKIWLTKPYKAPKKEKSNIVGIEDKGEVGGRFIEYKGIPVDEIEYCKIKLSEMSW